MASMRMGGVLTWAQSSRRSKLERTDLNTGSGSDLYAAMHRGLGRAPGDPLQVRLLPVSHLCLPCVLSRWVCAAPSSFTFNGSGNSGVWDSAGASRASGWRVTKAAAGLAQASPGLLP